jgi:uncharacterized protein (DUF488 family)
MKTSNFKTYKGDLGVAICIYPPLDFKGIQFPSLAPDRQTFFAKKADEIDEKEYEKQYRERVLSRLDPNHVYDMFANNVLLCWEPPGEFCHRRIVADWIKEELGIAVPEWKPGDDDPDDNVKPLF